MASCVAEVRKKKASRAEAKTEISKLVGRLQGLKRKLEGWHQQSEADFERAHVRLQHLRSHELASAGSGEGDCDRAEKFARERIDRLLADHLARHGMLESAKLLVEQADVGMLVDMHVLEQAQPVVAALEQGDMAPGIKWCIANRPRLKKIKSTLEFQLRLQAFVELVRKDALQEAICYARKYVGPAVAGDGHEHRLSALKRYMGVLAFGKGTQVHPYKFFLQVERRTDLAERVLCVCTRACTHTHTHTHTHARMHTHHTHTHTHITHTHTHHTHTHTHTNTQTHNDAEYGFAPARASLMTVHD